MARRKMVKRAEPIAAQETPPLLQLGDRVRILHYGGQQGRIVEFRGPLGPGGARIYRVRIPRKAGPTYIELREDQLEPVAVNG